LQNCFVRLVFVFVIYDMTVTEFVNEIVVDLYGFDSFRHVAIAQKFLLVCSKCKAISVQAYYSPREFQEDESRRFRNDWYMKLVSPTHRPPLVPGKYGWYSFL
jgi:hypothetical protein